MLELSGFLHLCNKYVNNFLTVSSSYNFIGEKYTPLFGWFALRIATILPKQNAVSLWYVFKVARSSLAEVNENINLGYSHDQGYS